jgi:oxygen-independent coproporphyrinogen-3 oxidase
MTAEPSIDGPAAGSEIRHAYVHVPFCPTICPFCSFDVVERRAGAVAAYLDGLDREAATTVDRLDVAPLRTIYLGGGTPSYLRDAEFERLVAVLRRRIGWADEVTLEVHPSTATRDRVRRWADAGVTRLSVGVQSFDDEVLAALGRSHSAADNHRVVEEALDTGVTVSLDLITAVPGQDLAGELRAAASTGVDHISAYTLTIEPGTPFARDGVEPAREREALESAASMFGAVGFDRYEVSNHARGGSRCAHNLAYWDNSWWLGLGPGATAHEPAGGSRAESATGGRAEWATSGPVVALRRTNPSLDEWLARWSPATTEMGPDPEPAPASGSESDTRFVLRGATELSRHAGQNERASGCLSGVSCRAEDRDLRDATGWAVDAVLAGLRRTEGVDLAVISARSGVDASARFGPSVDALVAAGRLTREGTVIRATTEGVFHRDGVMAELV